MKGMKLFEQGVVGETRNFDNGYGTSTGFESVKTNWSQKLENRLEKSKSDGNVLFEQCRWCAGSFAWRDERTRVDANGGRVHYSSTCADQVVLEQFRRLDRTAPEFTKGERGERLECDPLFRCLY